MEIQKILLSTYNVKWRDGDKSVFMEALLHNFPVSVVVILDLP